MRTYLAALCFTYLRMETIICFCSSVIYWIAGDDELCVDEIEGSSLCMMWNEESSDATAHENRKISPWAGW